MKNYPLYCPKGYRLWDKKQTKLEIAAEMVRSAMDSIGPDRQAFLLYDSWYPKGCVASLVDEFHNFCTKNPESIIIDYSSCEDETIRSYGEENKFFSCYQSASAQETRFGIGQQIQASIIFGSFVASLETVKKAQSFIKIIEGYVLSGFKNIQKL